MKYYIGIDIGGTNIKYGITDENGTIIDSGTIKTEAALGPFEIIRNIKKAVFDMMLSNSIKLTDIAGAGSGMPGLIDGKNGVTVYVSNMPGWNGLNFAELFEKETGIRIKIENDVRVIALGEEWQGAARGYENAVVITLGTGVGCGVIINGKILSGAHGFAGEIGHNKIDISGKLCGCGAMGCWENYSSATAIVKMAKDLVNESRNSVILESAGNDIEKLEAKHIFDAAKAGDITAQRIVHEFAEYTAMGIANAIHSYDPEIVVIGGGVALAGEFLLKKIEDKLKKYLLPFYIGKSSIVQAKLGNNAGIIGAARLAQM